MRPLVGHPVRVADQLDVRAERCFEVVDRLSGGGTVGERERPEELLDALRLHVRNRRADVGDVKGDVVARPVRVARMRVPLARRLVLKELDVRASADPEHRDLVDHRARIDAEQVLHLEFLAGRKIGPKESGASAPMTSWNQATASPMSGTVRPTWSVPTRPSLPLGTLHPP